MKPFDLNRFLSEQELSPAMLARHLRVSELYLLAVMAGQEALSERERAACLSQATRLARARQALRAVQIELPFPGHPTRKCPWTNRNERAKRPGGRASTSRET